MNVLSCYDLSTTVLKGFSVTTRVYFIRINPYPVNETLKEIYTIISDMSWLNKYDRNILKDSLKQRANKTIEVISAKLKKSDDDKITYEAGEYIVSVLGRQAIIEKLNYISIPLAEIWKERTLGNPGFDFHSESLDSRVIFGEAKYVSGKNAYWKALGQINDFIINKKDLEEIIDLEKFISDLAMNNFEQNNKGYAAAFSSTKIDDETLIKNIFNNDDFKKLLNYDELILVAVDLNE